MSKWVQLLIAAEYPHSYRILQVWIPHQLFITCCCLTPSSAGSSFTGDCGGWNHGSPKRESHFVAGMGPGPRVGDGRSRIHKGEIAGLSKVIDVGVGVAYYFSHHLINPSVAFSKKYVESTMHRVYISCDSGWKCPTRTCWLDGQSEAYRLGPCDACRNEKRLGL